MKNGLLLLFLLPAATGCMDFRHAHYRGIRKVPAEGIVSTGAAAPELPVRVPVIPSRDSVCMTEEKEQPLPSASFSPAAVPHKPPAKTTRSLKSAPAAYGRKKALTQPVKRNAPNEGMAALISLVIICFALMLLFSGTTLIIFALLYSTPWMAALGLLYCVLGYFPVSALVRNLVIGSGKHDPREPSRRKL